MKPRKGHTAVREKVPAEALPLADAVALVQKNARASFDETIELHIRLGADPSKSEQSVRGSVVLPHGSPKKKRIAVFTDNVDDQKAAMEAGATITGGSDLLADIEASGKLDADITIAAPDMMPKVAKIAKILGPKGLMPNPKTGTVTPDVAAAVAALAAGQVSFKMDKQGIVHESVGKVSWDTGKIVENTQAVLDAVRLVRPAGIKGGFIESITLASTMGPGVRVSL